MHRRCLLRALLAFFYGALSGLSLGSSAFATGESRFQPTTCGDLPDTAELLPRLRCGMVSVPRDYSHPDGSTFALAVVVIASAQQPARSDPVVYISGGPGSPLTIYTGYQARHPYASDRDLILIDQRGTGRSEPRLCPELQGDLVNAMLDVIIEPTRAAIDSSRAFHAACRDALVARGIDLDAFGTATTVEDFERVRRALGVTRWNVVGESYGTTVAMTLLTRYPGSIRSAVLDSLNPSDAYFGMPWSARVRRARDALFAACETDPACAASYSGLAARYGEALVRLGQDAAIVPLPSALHVPADRARLTPSLFEEIVGRLVYYPAGFADLPRLIAATRNGDLKPVGTALATLLAEAKRNDNKGAFVAVECRDRPHWREPPPPDVSPLDLGLLPPGVCATWSAIGPEPELPFDTMVPTLVLAGQFDPNITLEQSRRVAHLMGPHVRWVEFFGIGHNVRHFSQCAQGLVAAFIAEPDREHDTACANGDRRQSIFAPALP